MSVASNYSSASIKQLSKIEYMRKATYDEMINPPMIFRVARYCRESTSHADQVLALKNQCATIDNMVLENKNYVMDDRHKFTEEGVSGTNVEHREAFNLMLDCASRREFDILIVQDVCRFARNIIDLLQSIETLKQYDVGVLFVSGNYWTLNLSETDILCLAIDGGPAQAESMRTSKRINNNKEVRHNNAELDI